MPMELYGKLIDTGVLKRSPEYKINHIFRRVELDLPAKLKVESGELLVRYVTVLEERLGMIKQTMSYNKKKLATIKSSDPNIEYSERMEIVANNWKTILNELLIGRVDLNKEMVLILIQGDYGTIFNMFE